MSGIAVFYNNLEERVFGRATADSCILNWAPMDDAERVVLSIHPSEFFIDYHAHEFFEFNYILRGSCVNVVEGKTISMNEGDILLMPPGIYHAVFASKESYVLNISIAPDFFGAFCEEFSGISSRFSEFLSSLDSKECYLYFLCRDCREIESVVWNMIEHCLKRFNPKYYAKDGFLEQICKIYGKNQELGRFDFLLAEIRLKEILLLMLRYGNSHSELPNKQKKNSALMVSIFDYINKNYQNITLTSLAARFRYSETHISRLLKEKTGLSFADLLINVRLSHALVLLCDQEMKICEISQRIGYEAPSYFYRLFKKNFGITPLEYRKRYTSKAGNS